MAGRKRNPRATIQKDGYEYREGFLIRRLEKPQGVRYQVNLGKIDGRNSPYRPEFKTLSEARKCAKDRSIELANYGIRARNLPDIDRTDAIEALDILKEFGANLRTAANFYAKHHKKIDQTNGFAPLIEQYLAEQEKRADKGELRPRTLHDMQERLKPFKTNLGHLAIDAIEAKDIDSLMDSMGFKGTNRQNYKRYLGGFFNWAIKQKRTLVNPVLQTETVKIEVHTPEIYTPTQVQALFNACYDKDKPRIELIPYLAIAFFAGVRPDEIMRLDWKDIDLSLGEIHILAKHSKTRHARIVHASNNLKAWLMLYRQKEGPIFPYSETSLKRWRKEIHRTAGAAVIQDGARHTFATFYLALNGIDDTLQELGHTNPKMLFRHYRGLAKNRKGQAKKFFEIRPPQGRVVEFPTKKKGVA